MKINKMNIVMVIFLTSFLLLPLKVYTQEIKYNEFNEDELKKKEAEARKNAKPGVADPYYENVIKSSWDKTKEEKAKELIEGVKKDYGTETFDKSTLEKGPLKKEEDTTPKLYPTPPADPYYEEHIKSSWEQNDQTLKSKLTDTIKQEVEGKEKKESKPEELKRKMPGGDPYYEEEIQKSWDKDNQDILDKAKKELDKENAIKKEEKKESK
jgi:hypothetical protein